MKERELKFSTTEPGPPDETELAQALRQAGLELGSAKRVHNKDRYYDDARLSLSRAGLALRRRLSEGEALATLKSRGWTDGALHDRDEIELPLDGQDWPQPIVDRVAAVTAPGFLEPHTVLETERVKYAVLEDGRPVATLSFDAVTGQPQSGSMSVHFDEVEIEAIGSTDVAVLERVSEAVGSIAPLVPNEASKLERVRQLLLLGDW